MKDKISSNFDNLLYHLAHHI